MPVAGQRVRARANGSAERVPCGVERRDKERAKIEFRFGVSYLAGQRCLSREGARPHEISSQQKSNLDSGLTHIQKADLRARGQGW